jgi:hypothetical protein
MWQVKTFKTREAYQAWASRNSRRYQIEEIAVNNGYGADYRPLKIIGKGW